MEPLAATSRGRYSGACGSTPVSGGALAVFSMNARQSVGAVAPITALSAVLCYGVLSRITQMLTLYWKVGEARTTAGTKTLIAFVIAALLCAIAGVVVARHSPPRVSQIATLSAVVALVSCVVWLLLIASPLVELLPR